MKAYLIILSLLAASMTRGLAADPMSEALQKGLLAEEASQNPQAAIQAYQSVLKQYEEQRRIAATAAFRLGETYRKLGKTNEAHAQFERVLREFESEDTLASLSRKYLGEAGLTPSSGGAEAASVDPEEIDLLKREIELVQQQIVEQEKRFETGQIPQAELWQTRRQLFPLLRNLPENADPKRQEDLIKQEIESVQQTLQMVRKMQEVGKGTSADRMAAERDLLNLQRQLLAARRPAVVRYEPRLKSIVKRSDELATTDEETKEIQRIRSLIRNSPDLINARDLSGITELYKAAHAGHLTVVRFLLDSNANVNAGEGSSPGTPLHAAADAGNKAVVELLLSRGANVNAKDHNDATPLHQAAAKGYQAVAQVLLAKGAEVNARNRRDGATPLHHAVGGNHRAMVELLLANDAEINAEGPRGITPLFTAVMRGRLELASLLLEKGSAVNATEETGATPLAWAVRNNDPNMVKLLLSKGADPNAKDGQANTPLTSAIGPLFQRTVDPVPAKSPEVASLREIYDALVARGAHLKDVKAPPAIMQASELGNIEQVSQLLELGVGVDSRFLEGFTPLHAAAASGKTNVVELLLAKGANVNVQDESGNTPLHYAVFGVRKPVVERLLAAGARTDIQNLEERTPEQMVYDPRSPGAYSRQWGIPVKQRPSHGAQDLVTFGSPRKLAPEIQELFDRSKKPADSPDVPDSAQPKTR